MDSLHAVGFYASSGISLAGALGVALLQAPGRRALALGVAGVGLAGIYLSLSAGFVAAVALVCYLASGYVLTSPRYHLVDVAVPSLWRQIGAVGAAVLVAVLAYSAFRGNFITATFYGGAFDTAALGRILFEHDAFAVEAIAALTLVAAAGGTVVWRMRDRAR